MYNMSPKLSHEHTLDHTRKRRTIFFMDSRIWTPKLPNLDHSKTISRLCEESESGSGAASSRHGQTLRSSWSPRGAWCRKAEVSSGADGRNGDGVLYVYDYVFIKCVCFCVLGQFWMDFHQLILMRKFGNQVDIPSYIPLRLCKLQNCTYSSLAPPKIGCLDRGKAHSPATGRTIRGARELAIGVTSQMKHLDLD